MRSRALDRASGGRWPGKELEDLYARHVGYAGRLAYLLVGDRDVAADIAQEAFVRLAGRFSHIRNAASFEPYLRRTVLNLCRSHLRRLRVERTFVRKYGRPLPDATFPDIESRDELVRLMLLLPYRQRAVIALRYYEDLSEESTAELLSCSVRAVDSLVARGLEVLRRELEVEHHGAQKSSF